MKTIEFFTKKDIVKIISWIEQNKDSHPIYWSSFPNITIGAVVHSFPNCNIRILFDYDIVLDDEITKFNCIASNEEFARQGKYTKEVRKILTIEEFIIKTQLKHN